MQASQRLQAQADKNNMTNYPSLVRPEAAPLTAPLVAITLNNARSRTLQRSVKAEPLIKQIRDIIASGSNVLLDDGNITVGVMSSAGSAAFMLGVNGLPVVMCQACWRADVSNTCWEAGDSRFQRLAERNGALDFGYEYREAPPVPWLTSVLLPEISRISQKHQQAIGALEPCIVWALWDNEREGATKAEGG